MSLPASKKFYDPVLQGYVALVSEGRNKPNENFGRNEEKTMKSKLLTLITLAVLTVAGSVVAQAQSWTQHINWSATNSDAGGSVDCPVNYISLGVEYAIATGGRSAVINEALFAAYRGDVGRAFQLVLLTQCHSPNAQGELIQAGQNAVVGYLVQNWTPTGVDPQTVQQGVHFALSILAGS